MHAHTEACRNDPCAGLTHVTHIFLLIFYHQMCNDQHYGTITAPSSRPLHKYSSNYANKCKLYTTRDILELVVAELMRPRLHRFGPKELLELPLGHVAAAPAEETRCPAGPHRLDERPLLGVVAYDCVVGLLQRTHGGTTLRIVFRHAYPHLKHIGSRCLPYPNQGQSGTGDSLGLPRPKLLSRMASL